MNKTIIRITRKLFTSEFEDLNSGSDEFTLNEFVMKIFESQLSCLDEFDLTFQNLCDYLYLIIGSTKPKRKILSSIRHHFVKIKTTIN